MHCRRSSYLSALDRAQRTYDAFLRTHPAPPAGQLYDLERVAEWLRTSFAEVLDAVAHVAYMQINCGCSTPESSAALDLVGDAQSLGSAMASTPPREDLAYMRALSRDYALLVEGARNALRHARARLPAITDRDIDQSRH